MWSQTQNHTPGQAGVAHHSMASLAAHSAARRAAVGRILAGGGGPGPGGPPATTQPPAVPLPGAGPMAAPSPQHSYKAHIAAAGAAHGVPLGMGDIHGAIDSLTQQGHFTPYQGSALKAHNGPLQGHEGVQTMHAITAQALKQTPRPGAMPMAGTGQ